MRNSFDMQLRKLNNELIEMGSLIETAIARAYKGLINQNIEIAKENVEFDREIDQKEKEVERLPFCYLLSRNDTYGMLYARIIAWRFSHSLRRG